MTLLGWFSVALFGGMHCAGVTIIGLCKIKTQIGTVKGEGERDAKI